jgi:hypothetical protein
LINSIIHRYIIESIDNNHSIVRSSPVIQRIVITDIDMSLYVEKTSLHGDDLVIISDSEDGYTNKKVKAARFGDGGTAGYIWEAGEDIGGHKIVYVESGKIYKASNLVLAQIGRVIGMTTEAIMTGSTGAVRLIGKLNNPGWGLTANKPYFLTTDGAMNENVPASGFIQQVGASIDTENFAIDIKSPIIRG